MNNLLETLTPGLTETASHRRTESNQPNRAFQPILATYPGQYVEIDPTTLDVETAMPDGKIVRPYMTAAVDVYSGSVAGFHITPVPLHLVRSLTRLAGSGTPSLPPARTSCG